MTNWIGWLATAIFALSYRCRERAMLMRVQALAAGLWIVYGLALGALPVVVANLIVAGMAAWSGWRTSVAAPAPRRAA